MKRILSAEEPRAEQKRMHTLPRGLGVHAVGLMMLTGTAAFLLLSRESGSRSPSASMVHAGLLMPSAGATGRGSSPAVEQRDTGGGASHRYSRQVVAHAQEQQAPRVAFFTYAASDSRRYIRMALLQQYAARKYMPDQQHTILISTKVPKDTQDALRKAGANVQLINPFPERHQHGATWVDQLTKIKLWSMTEYDIICYLDADVIFFANITSTMLMHSGCSATLLDPAINIDICGWENEGCEKIFRPWNRNYWGQPYLQASIFCIHPSMHTYAALLKGGVERLQSKPNITLAGRNVRTEQDFINMYFSGRIHYYPCSFERGGRGNGTIVHTKGVEKEWLKREGTLPPALDAFPLE